MVLEALCESVASGTQPPSGCARVGVDAHDEAATVPAHAQPRTLASLPMVSHLSTMPAILSQFASQSRSSACGPFTQAGCGGTT